MAIRILPWVCLSQRRSVGYTRVTRRTRVRTMTFLLGEVRMSDARTRRVLQTIADYTVGHRRATVLAAGAVAVAALTLAVRYGGLAGVALLIALAAMGAATGLWLRMRETEQSHAALALTVAELTTRLDLLSVAPSPVLPVTFLADQDIEVDGTGATAVKLTAEMTDSDMNRSNEVGETQLVVDATTTSEPLFAGVVAGAAASAVALDSVPPAQPTAIDNGGSQTLDLISATTVKSVGVFVPAVESQPLGPDGAGDTDILPLAISTGEIAAIVESDPDGPDLAEAAVTPLVAGLQTLEAMPAFILTALNGAVVTDAGLKGTPAVVVFWRPGCQHCQRLTPELVAWESLQGPRLVVFAACDGPTAYRAGLPGLVILDPGFTVGQAIGAPGTPAALPLDAAGRPSGPVVAGASAVTALLLDAMRDWASVEAEPLPQLSAIGVEVNDVSASDTDTVEAANAVPMAPPTVLLRRVEEIPSDVVASDPDWDAQSVVRRTG